MLLNYRVRTDASLLCEPFFSAWPKSRYTTVSASKNLTPGESVLLRRLGCRVTISNANIPLTLSELNTRPTRKSLNYQWHNKDRFTPIE